MQEYITMWKNYANFTGKTDRRGFWMAILFHYLAFLTMSVFGLFFPRLGLLVMICVIIYTYAMVVAILSLMVRRLQDAGYRWTTLLFGLIPLVGWIIVLVLVCMPSMDEGFVDVA